MAQPMQIPDCTCFLSGPGATHQWDCACLVAVDGVMYETDEKDEQGRFRQYVYNVPSPACLLATVSQAELGVQRHLARGVKVMGRTLVVATSPQQRALGWGDFSPLADWQPRPEDTERARRLSVLFAG